MSGGLRRMSRGNDSQKSTRRKKPKSGQTRTWSMRKNLLIGWCAAVGMVLIVIFVIIPGLEGGPKSISAPKRYSAPHR